MKLDKCIKIGKECRLTTLGEAFDNISYHSATLFKYTNTFYEMRELRNEIAKEYNLTEISHNIDKIEL